MEQQQRFLTGPGTELRVNGLAGRIRPDQLRVDPVLDENVLQILRAGGLVSRRIRRVNPDVADQRILGLLLDRVFRRALSARAPHQQEKEKTRR